jgi:hypothetical protein
VGLLLGTYTIHITTQEFDLHNLTPAQIRDIVAAGNARDYWQVGDEFDIMTPNLIPAPPGFAHFPITFQVYGYNYETRADGSSAPTMTAGTKHLMVTPIPMNSHDTNIEGFAATTLRNHFDNQIFGNLAREWRDVIVPVIKEGEALSVFPLSSTEVFGGANAYPIFTDDASRVKRMNNETGEPFEWWLTNRALNNNTHFAFVPTNGNVAGAGAGQHGTTALHHGRLATTWLGICLAFTIGGTA